MPKISKSAVFNAAKISAGCAAAIVISTLLGVKYSATAGLITVLSIQNTKKETAEIALKRLISFITAIITSFISFRFLGYTTTAFAVYLFVFILICGLLRAQSAIVPVSVLIAHILSEKHFDLQIVINEFLLLFIGAGTGFLLNLYLHRDTKKMAEYRTAVDDEIKAIIGRMADRVLVSDKSDYTGDCFRRLDGYMKSARDLAVLNRQNSLINNDNYDLLYLDMRQKQCTILYEMYKSVKEMDSTPEQAHILSELLKKIKDEYHEYNNVSRLLEETNKVITEMKNQKMPESRKEFENRASLYNLMIRTREFLTIKKMFMENNK
ncbi:aromatic acid exporter family protein [Ruminococcus sp. HUN007]|uniref:aromatic acid exporter family protein n=1 Tax=Ruminococcus sp. HUN007 TaxID=1514668 RepID=UPI0005D1B79D|nr:aromatic acid exporter family protein [Ruminococcus sp. HUN007]